MVTRRTINILTRSNNNVAVLVNLSRNLIAILIGSRNLGVLIRVCDLDTIVMLLIGRLNRLHTRIIKLGRLLIRVVVVEVINKERTAPVNKPNAWVSVP